MWEDDGAIATVFERTRAAYRLGDSTPSDDVRRIRRRRCRGLDSHAASAVIEHNGSVNSHVGDQQEEGGAADDAVCSGEQDAAPDEGLIIHGDARRFGEEDAGVRHGVVHAHVEVGVGTEAPAFAEENEAAARRHPPYRRSRSAARRVTKGARCLPTKEKATGVRGWTRPTSSSSRG